MTKKEIILKLLEAKRHSDKGQYTQKREIIHHLLQKYPKQFKIDSRQFHTVGLTHTPSRFKIHTVKSGLPDEFLQKAAAYIELQKIVGIVLGEYSN